MPGIGAAFAALPAIIQVITISAVSFAANTALSSIMAEGAPDVSFDTQKTEGRGHLVNTRSTQAPIPRIYGRCRVGINQAYIGVSGDDNKYLHIIGVVGEGEVNGIAQTGGVDQFFLNDKLYTEYGDLVYYEFFNGSATQNACATLHDAIPEWDDPLRYTAYLYLRLEYDGDKFQSLPEITLEVEGLKVYNPSTELTEYTTNPALGARDYTTASSQRGGMGIAASRLDDSTFTGTASYCTTKGWTIGMPVRENKPAIDNLTSILSCFRGAQIYSNNKFKLRYKDMNYESPVMSLDENDIVDAGESTLEIVQPSIFDTPNAVRMKFLNSEKKYQTDDYVLSDPDAIAADGDYREKTVEIPGINSYENIQKMANYYLERFRINKTTSFVGHNRLVALEPLDLIQLTHSMPGWDNKMFRVTGASFSPDNVVPLDLIEESSNFYDDTYNPQDHDWHDTNLPDPAAAVPSVINVSHEEEVYYYRGRSFTRWKIDFDPPANYPWWDYAEIWVKVGVAGDWKFKTKATTDFMLDPVEEGETYYCKIRSVSIYKGKENFDTAQTVSKEIAGKTDAPTDISALTAVASGDTVTLFSQELADPDILGYEIRLGSAWVGGIFMGFNETPNIRLTSVRPGTHTFWIAAKNNGGLYSPNPVSAQCVVYYPPNYVDKNTWSWDFTTGTHDNTEHGTYNGQDILKCSHTGGVLTGKWTSPVYDLAAIKTVKTWGDFMTVVPVTWAMVFGSGTWDSKIAGGKKWYEILVPSEASSLNVTLKWGDAADQLDNEAKYFEILAPEIRGRYVQVEITITDPSNDVYMLLYKLNMKAAYWQ